MKKQKKIRIRYVYVEPKTSEEKKSQQKVLDGMFDDIFNRILENKK